MRSTLHPQAKFDPIPPDLDLHGLVDRTPNFDWVTRISIAQIRRLGPTGFEKLVQLHVIEGGRPLVIEGWDRVLPKDLFSAAWLEKTADKKQENVRDITAQVDIPMTTGHYLRSMRQLTNQWNPTNFRDERRQRLYLKDIDCPDEWIQHLKKIIPPNLFYMNENISETPNSGSRNDDIFGAPEKTSAIAGDLMSSLDQEMRAQNLMCYIGHEGTYTPAHREMCASLGQNIMVDASGNEEGEKEGSSIWFMTETKDREVVREYFLSMLGHDIEIEKHFAQVNAWKKANFPVYIVEQKVGDFILVPPLAPHQVWNRGTRTMKVAWNRTTVETLDLALHEALPKARLVCRDEQYKNKAIIYYTLEKYHKELQSFEDSADVSWLGLGQELMQNSARMKQMARDFKKLFGLFTEILVDEMFGDKQMNVEYIPFDSNITCSYCRANIFNRFLTCKGCVRQLINGDEDTYDICMNCYAMGRSCVCISGLQWCEQWQWSELVDKHETWRAMVIEQDGFVDIDQSPQPLELARKISGKKSAGQICQEQLRKRPWNDITKPPEREPEESDDPEVDDDGRIKKKPKKRKKKQGETYRCHVCSHRDFIYKLHFCATCTSAYCYGVLWRAFDMMPQAVMEQEHWQCPKCLKICNCGACRQSGNTVPYIPKNTLLGHDTRPIADDRSVESIVDFRVHNLGWLKAAGEENRSKDSKRMNRLKQQADAEKAKELASFGADAGADADMDVDANNDTREADAALQDSITNGHGDQSHIVDPRPHGDGEHQAPVSHGEPGSQVATADMSGLQDAEGESVYPDPSNYPDPTMLDRGRMMGMGFYEQDESTDRILFDAFQMPTADVLNNEPEISEFVRKTLRLAKRKARLEQDNDPDFQGPKRYRKKPRTGNIEQLVNLDPALLGSLGDSTPIPTRDTAPNHVATGDAASTANGQDEERGAENPTPVVLAKPKRIPLPIDPLRPTLRHAKPMTSYVEAEEPPEDPDDAIPVRPARTEDAQAGQEPRPSAIDLAAEAVRSITGTPAPAPLTATEATPQYTGKRRGRPPRSSLGTSSSSPVTEMKRRGRPPGTRQSRRSTLSRVENAEDTDMADADDAEQETTTIDDLEAQLAEEPGSPDDEDTAQSDYTPSKPAPTTRRRGRPPGVRRPQAVAASPAEPEKIPEPTKTFQSMSLQERMALKGKKIRIGQRKRQEDGGTATSTPTRSQGPGPIARNTSADEARLTPRHGRAELVDDDFNPSAAEGSPSVSSVSEHEEPPSLQQVASRPRGPRGPTIVSLHISDDESSAGSGFNSSDDEIPAKPVSSFRGRGRGRGRGSRWATRGRG
ncbi:hypothetical protein SAMD00023353_3400450 [Rosellinia necatrix]|uniref:JmjC domain-containing protein n=1 Tax=Rosellinia necatrix TaxID=77044 RepID=A0A1W2TL01_ROSNE|nr:hypothetical protein SAMD00023353_3400450 [Rosellinia necatrix]